TNGGEEMFFAEWNERSTLAAEGDVLVAEIRDERAREIGGDSFAVANLRGEAVFGLVENRVSVGGRELRFEIVALDEIVEQGTEQMSVFDVRPGKKLGGFVLERFESSPPFRRIRAGDGFLDLVGPEVV